MEVAMLIVEAEQGKTKVGETVRNIGEVLSLFASIFDLKQLLLKTLDGKIQTLWFNKDSYVIKELVPADIRGAVKKEYGIS